MHNGIESLNGLLRGEISAVETYNQALKSLDKPAFADTLQKCQACHEGRVMQLRDKIAAMGGQPSTDSGAWGSFAKFMEGAATAMGDKPSIALLEEGEDHGLKVYRDEMKECDDAAVRAFIQSELLPKQENSHGAMRTLKATLN